MTIIDNDNEDFHIDFEKIFKLISMTKYRKLYLENLPKEIQDLQFQDLDNEKEVTVKEYLLNNYGEDKIH